MMTLSIGIGRGSNILRELDELAFLRFRWLILEAEIRLQLNQMMNQFVSLVEIVKAMKNQIKFVPV